jgi:hypothetical protein
MTQTEKQDHARQNAAAWAASIAQMVAALECDYDRLEELRDERADMAGAVERATLASDKAMCALALGDWDEENGDELKELTADATIDGDLQTDADSVRERIQESPLEVAVRSGWVPSAEDMVAEDFLILLSTGGPALRIRGELDQHKQPRRAWLEYQDWGTPWTEYHGDGCEQKTLLTFCQQFFFGE